MGDPNSLEQGRKRMKSITTKVLIAVALGAYALSSGSSKVEGQNTGSKQEASQQETVSKLRKAAEQGDAEAQYNLGVRYANGEGVPEDYKEAVKWFRKAAEQGFAAAHEFAYETDLRDFLASNLHVIRPSLTLYQDGDISGVEFPVGERRIDILAVEDEKDFVVIELKVSKGYDRAVGQLLRYMAWIEQNLAEPGQKVKGMIIARRISDDLRLATSRVSDVELYEYQMSISLSRVEK